MIINNKERFSTLGIRFWRHNADGTIATAKRFVGFAGTVDLTDVLSASNRADVTIKIDANPAETKSVDFALADDKTKVTVAEAVEALEEADFTGITFSVDSHTGRLKGVSSTGDKVQIYSKLAAALDFGQSAKHGGLGLKIISKFDDQTIDISLAKDIKDKEEITSEGANGTQTRMIIGAMLQGMSPVVALKEKDYDLLELVQGGDLDREKGTYNPPGSHESDHPSFCAEIFSPIYSSGSNKMSDMVGFERIFLRSMNGNETDVPIEAKAWAKYSFALTATDYTEFVDGKEVKWPAWEEGTVTVEEFDALKVKQI